MGDSSLCDEGEAVLRHDVLEETVIKANNPDLVFKKTMEMPFRYASHGGRTPENREKKQPHTQKKR